MNFSRRVLASATVILVLGLMGAGVYLRLNAGDGEDGSPAAAAGEGETPDVSAASRFATDIAIPVEGAPARRDTLVIGVTAAGKAEAWRRTVLTANVPGRVTRVSVRENSPVRETELLARIDTTEYALAVDRARSELLKARGEYQQLTLFDEEIDDPALRAERERFARSRSGLDQAEVALKEAELRLAQTRVRAPFPGRVANLEVVEGEWAEQGAELLEIVDLDPIKVEVQVLESEMAYLEEGREASVTFPAAYPGERFRGEIATINPVVDPETSTVRVTVVLPNPEGRFKPGNYARVSLDARRYGDRILVPREAILERDRRTMLFVFDGEGPEGRSEWRYVTTGLENDSLVEIVPDPETKMVEPGEVVLTDGHFSLIHDAKVRLVEDVEEAGGRPR